MAAPALAGLNLRHIDPTQAFTKDRVDKGLVESLMLKRAKCMVYSVQDTDTLGKGSELAATLAQGKPVIAYVPAVAVDARAVQSSPRIPPARGAPQRFTAPGGPRCRPSARARPGGGFAPAGESGANPVAATSDSG
jgi:hypothetical protein